MLHNSLLIRDRLRATNNDELHRGRRDPHRWLGLLAGPDPRAGEIALTGAWSVLAVGSMPGLDEACADLTEFLTRGGVAVSDNADLRIQLEQRGDVEFGCHRRIANTRAISIQASDPTGMWAGVVDLERTIALRRSPVLPEGTVERSPRWPVQISQAPFGANYLVPDLSADFLSDDVFRLLAHFGVNGMTIYGDWLLYVDHLSYPELSHPDAVEHLATLQDAARRAMRYGVRLYFVPVSPKLTADHPIFQRLPGLRGARIHTGLVKDGPPIHNFCSSSAEGLDLHGSVFSRLFREVPDLGGLILIVGGESYYHCFMRPDRTSLAAGEKTNCPHCVGHQPEVVVAGLLAATADAVHDVAPDALILAWPYSAHVWSGEPDQTELVRQLPGGVGLLTEIDKDAWVTKDGYRKRIWDYSVDFTGPSDRASAQAAIVREQGNRLAIKTETALGLECTQVPYVPALNRLGEKWANVAALQPEAVLQSWMFFGMWGSRAEELGWWANWRAEVPLDDALRQMAERDFGAHTEAALSAWDAMSEAAGRLPYIPPYFHGPEFIGPCHPLPLDSAIPSPERYSAALYYLQENEATFATTAKEIRHSLLVEELPAHPRAHAFEVGDGRDAWSVVLAEWEACVAAAARAYRALRDITAVDDAVAEELAITEWLYRTWRTTLNTLRVLLARKDGEALPSAARGDAIRAVMDDELPNAQAARRIVREHPWLNLRLRMDGDYPDSLRMLDEKIALLEASMRGARQTAD